MKKYLSLLFVGLLIYSTSCKKAPPPTKFELLTVGQWVASEVKANSTVQPSGGFTESFKITYDKDMTYDWYLMVNGAPSNKKGHWSYSKNTDSTWIVHEASENPPAVSLQIVELSSTTLRTKYTSAQDNKIYEVTYKR